MLVATKGIGQTLMMARESADINKVTAIMIMIVFLGLFVDNIIFKNITKRLAHGNINFEIR